MPSSPPSTLGAIRTWFCLVGAPGLLPAFAHFLRYRTIEKTLAEGELLITAAIVCAAGLERTVACFYNASAPEASLDARFREWVRDCHVASVFFIFATVLWYGFVVATGETHEGNHIDVTWPSVVIALAAYTMGAFAVHIHETVLHATMSQQTSSKGAGK